MLTPTREAIIKSLELILTQMLKTKANIQDIQKIKEIINNLKKEGK